MNITEEHLEEWISANKLLSVKLKNPKDGKETIVGRLIKYEKSTKTLLVYVDDTKSLSNLLISNVEQIVSVV